ncbi:hypothetical protein [Ilyobacter sp.]|jgi:hypothetical protein|uniref:hypothetical protein n=1 Tax=Ilyobacter sp. TaxID=3100343 RepID=UPI003562C7AF
MVNFEKVDEMINIIEDGDLKDGKNFNQFAIEFYLESKSLPLSKYLRMQKKTKKMPKIMNTKKAGEVLYFTEKDDDAKRFLKRKGYSEIPQLNYTCIMLLRKVDIITNWTKVLSYFEGKGTIEEINNSTRTELLPEEKKKMDEFIKEKLKLSEKEYDWFCVKLSKVFEDREIMKALKKVIR